jgi:hypothetical protein
LAHIPDKNPSGAAEMTPLKSIAYAAVAVFLVYGYLTSTPQVQAEGEVDIDADYAIKTMIDDAKFSNIVNPARESIWTSVGPSKGKYKAKMRLYRFPYIFYATNSGVLSRIEKEACRPANLRELLAFVQTRRKALLYGDQIVALGSTTTKGNSQLVPVVNDLFKISALSELVTWNGWSTTDNRFLAVCN